MAAREDEQVQDGTEVYWKFFERVDRAPNDEDARPVEDERQG
ncbi:MAG TPA: hypothetical protein VFJ58_00665 [Armatimonadota bacterium]|nr:hypothetical protein [Armatimonadota bacterium]